MPTDRQARDDAIACKPYSWEIKRQLRPGVFQTYAAGYFHPLWTLTIFTPWWSGTIIGRKRLVRTWNRG